MHLIKSGLVASDTATRVSVQELLAVSRAGADHWRPAQEEWRADPSRLWAVFRGATKEPGAQERPISGGTACSALTPYLPTGPAGQPPMPGSPVPASPAHPQWGLSRDQVWL